MISQDKVQSDPVFPFLDSGERELLTRFAEAVEAGKSQEKATESFMQLIRRFYEGFFCSPLNSPLRQHFRAKLLNIAGVYSVVSPKEIFQFIQAKRDEKSRERKPLSIKSIFAPSMEVQAKELCQFKELKLLLLLEERAGKSYFEYCVEHADFIVFRQNLSEEIKSNVALSASSEALSRSILVQSQLGTGEERDEFSIVFDIVYQAAILDFFYQASVCVDAIACEKSARTKALSFASSAKELFRKHAKLDSQFLSYLDELIAKNQERIHSLS